MSRSLFYILLAALTAIAVVTMISTYAYGGVELNLADPEEAEDPQVVQGYKIMQLTPILAKEYAGDRLSCNNCHFNGGNTPGGENNGISLVGVTDTYPRFSERAEGMIDLQQRISSCFERSLNGKPLPPNDPLMEAIVAYLHWISEPVKEMKEKPWLGLKKLKSKHVPNAQTGLVQYELHCAICHKSDGSGSYEEEGDNVPPLFGEHSFNDGAGMAKPEVLAAFIHLNMPQGQPYLTETQALDIAEYISKQPRPHFQHAP